MVTAACMELSLQQEPEAISHNRRTLSHCCRRRFVAAAANAMQRHLREAASGGTSASFAKAHTHRLSENKLRDRQAKTCCQRMPNCCSGSENCCCVRQQKHAAEQTTSTQTTITKGEEKRSKNNCDVLHRLDQNVP